MSFSRIVKLFPFNHDDDNNNDIIIITFSYYYYYDSIPVIFILMFS